jgi:hypothetical protein
MLYYWCRVAGFDPLRVIHVAELLTAGGDEPRALPWRRLATGIPRRAGRSRDV